MLPPQLLTAHITDLFRCGRRRRPTHTDSARTASLAAEEACHSAAPGLAHISSKISSKADPFKTDPRTDYLSWEEYFMAVAYLSARRSKDPNKQVPSPATSLWACKSSANKGSEQCCAGGCLYCQ